MARVAERSVGPSVSGLEVLQARAEARAYLFGAGQMSLQEAVDGLQAWAEESGLTEQLGDDTIQQIMARAFAPWRS